MALLETRPDRPFWGQAWVESAFTAHLPGYATTASERLGGWSVGGCMGTETLVQSRPVARDTDDPVRDLLRAGARCSLGAVHEASTLPVARAAPPRIARFRRWLAVLAAPPLTENTRGEILGALPAFLGRDAARAPDAQLLLLALLAELYAATGFQNAYADAPALSAAIARFVERLGEHAPSALFVGDGRTLGAFHDRGCLLASHPPPEVRPTAGLVAHAPGHMPASLWLWNPQAPAAAPRDADRVAEGIFTVSAAEPGVVVRP